MKTTPPNPARLPHQTIATRAFTQPKSAPETHPKPLPKTPGRNQPYTSFPNEPGLYISLIHSARPAANIGHIEYPNTSTGTSPLDLRHAALRPWKPLDERI